ncbi:MAG: hypothetical protein ACPGJS_16020 [Flammeovirgaceae bacterium]
MSIFLLHTTTPTHFPNLSSSIKNLISSAYSVSHRLRVAIHTTIHFLCYCDHHPRARHKLTCQQRWQYDHVLFEQSTLCFQTIIQGLKTPYEHFALC